MKKLFFALSVVFLTINLNSCSTPELTENEENTELATGHGDSTNSGSTDEPAPDNGED
ncbi:hypothetical protein [Lacinutrix sp. Hel_I_90]|uniref:hypothetical protein n=1 Tax=Lacinutrix sp. Hel_I_90 TaxID=1249999 RepID=UPI000B2D03BA|nr:hypothetical protein [Lacinutrix sp. Hel_I_90]